MREKRKPTAQLPSVCFMLQVNKKLKKQLDIFFATSGGLTLKCFLDTVGPTLATLNASGVAPTILGAVGTAALGPLGIIGGAAALTSGWWLKELLKS